MTASKIVFLSERRAGSGPSGAGGPQSAVSGALADDPMLASAAEATVLGRLADPFAFLGPHPKDGGVLVRTFQPGARRVEVLARADGRRLAEAEHWRDGLFVAQLREDAPYRLRVEWADGSLQEIEDPYAFGAVLGDLDLHLFSEGSHWRLAEVFGGRPMTLDGIDGVAFSVWAPNARRVAVIGDFNSWDGRRHPMRLRHAAGIWELFVPRLQPGARYKYEIHGADGTLLPQKADPLARATEAPPANASIVAAPDNFSWSDADWIAGRAARQSADAPLSIYEVHAESWLRPDGQTLDWDGLVRRLIPYAVDMGFTHIELLPIMGHPFSGSWGYQPLSLFATAAALGERDGFKRFVDQCHRFGLGVILDWVPGHFPNDAHGLATFDGSHLYEHADPREGFHQDWNTCIYNYGRREVQGFLIASALHWLDVFHLDGLRVDAVASMLYRDYSREPGEWVPNIHGGRENLEAIAFLRRMNDVIAERHPGVVTIAEESTAWPGVTAPTAQGGLGFSYKWNMGWMHDSLRYMQREPIHRPWHHNDLTFGLLYAFSERFMLPLSHDEVVHGKGSLLARMPGDDWQRFANLRAYLAFMWAHPGKKLLFMGGEFAQSGEWSYRGELDWFLLDRPAHKGVQHLLRDLNKLYRDERALHGADTDSRGFRWLVGDDASNSVFAFLRCADGAPPMLCVFNMTPAPRANYRVGVPQGGYWRERLNSDGAAYGGGNAGNGGGVMTQNHGSHGQPHSLELFLPPLAGIILHPES